MAVKIAGYNNAYLEKYHTFVHKHHRMLTYLVDKYLKPLSRQPDYIENGMIYEIPGGSSQTKLEWMLAQTCGKGSWLEKKSNFIGNCKLLHHSNPYLKLGPFLEEQFSKVPYAVIFHDIIYDKEMEYLIAEARPKLSKVRHYNSNKGVFLTNDDIKSDKGRRYVTKKVQAWIPEAKWPKLVKPEDWVGKNYESILHPLLWKLNKRISLATRLVTNAHFSATPMQVSHYGLSGLIENHIDPVGIMEHDEQHIRNHQPELLIHGDTVGTFMAWLSDTEAGGGTAFLAPGYEGLLMPKRGAAGFWYDLMSDGIRDKYSLHGGCPVLKGEKWLLNKWIRWFDSVQTFPCKLTQKKRFDPPYKKDYL